MSCNPAIGGLAKGQLVREIDALNGLMGLAADATGIQFKVLNSSRGPAVHGPRAQCDKHAYAEVVQQMIRSRPEIRVIAGTVERLVVEKASIMGVGIDSVDTGPMVAMASCVVLTTGTFMRGLMHTGESKASGGRFGEAAAVGISATLQSLGFELGRLKTGTPPRLRRGSLRWDELKPALGDERPISFSDLSARDATGIEQPLTAIDGVAPSLTRFPAVPQVECRETSTHARTHDLIRENLHRAPMYSGQIESTGPRYCPSIEDKVVRFAERESHTVFLEPESLRDDWIYCNGISTSLPRDVQDEIVRSMPGCEQAEILRYGYAVEYDMVRPHQIKATGETKLVAGLFLAGQINGTSGYEEAAAQGLVAGANAARRAMGLGEFTIGREQGYIGVLMDDLVTKTPVEPYRMFTSRAEHRLILRADNASDRLTPMAMDLGLLPDVVGNGPSLAGRIATLRRAAFTSRRKAIERASALAREIRIGGIPLAQAALRNEFGIVDFIAAFSSRSNEQADARVLMTVYADLMYAPFIDRQRAEISRLSELEHRRIPQTFKADAAVSLRAEARQALAKFRPATFGQALRLEGMTPADITLLAVLVRQSASA